MIFLGFDTSNYTTSVAAYDCDTNDFINIRKILDVKTGERGLRQSDALFQHIKTLPGLFNELCKKTDVSSAKAIGISTRPRSIEGSYMPVFLAGKGFGEVSASSLNIPSYEFSHQDGHIMAGIYSSNSFALLNKPFISVHLSGGTTEILLCEYNGRDFSQKIIGGTKDISAGQLIDRFGVAIGLDFPSGKALEALALSAKSSVRLPVSTDKAYINFSGIETKSLSLISSHQKNELSLGLFEAVAEALVKTLSYCISEYKTDDILIVGGVASNSIIKDRLNKKLNADLHFASVEYSTDNACGIALLAKHFYFSKNDKGND